MTEWAQRALVVAVAGTGVLVGCGGAGDSDLGTGNGSSGSIIESEAIEAPVATTGSDVAEAAESTTSPDAVADDSAAVAAGSPARTEQIAVNAIDAMQAEDWLGLAALIGPDGLTISVDAYVDDADQTVSSLEILGAATDSTIRRWGESEEEGNFFESTLRDRLTSIVELPAITATEEESIDERLGSGNIIDNLGDVYPSGSFKEYWNGGVNPAFDGLDWTSVRLVVVGGHLRAIVLDQWAP